MVRARRTGVFGSLEPVAVRDRRWDDQDAGRMLRGVEAVAAGAPAAVRRRLEQLVDRTGRTDCWPAVPRTTARHSLPPTPRSRHS